MDKKIFLIFIIFSLTVSNGIIYAEESSGSNTFEVENLFKEKQKELKEGMRKNRLEEREEMKNEINNARENFQEKLRLKREENKEKLTENRENLQARIGVIKDEYKKDAVLNINENIGKINERTTDRLGHLINILEDILQRVENKMNIAMKQGLEISLVETSLKETKLKIAETKDLIQIQAEKIYKIEISNELNDKEEVSIIRDTLQDDLKNIQNKLKEAHALTRDSAQKLREILVILENEKDNKNVGE